jgi:RNA polymerase sigma factor (sigma-70 family)
MFSAAIAGTEMALPMIELDPAALAVSTPSNACREAQVLDILRSNAGLIRAYMHRVTSDRIEVEELVQECHAVVWEMSTNRSPPEPAREWLIGCCRRARAEWSRTRREVNCVEFAIDSQVVASIEEESAFQDHLENSAWAALLALPPRQREAIVYRVAWSWSVRQTAEAMKCREGTVKAHVHAGLRTMRARLGALNIGPS